MSRSNTSPEVKVGGENSKRGEVESSVVDANRFEVLHLPGVCRSFLPHWEGRLLEFGSHSALHSKSSILP